MDNSVIDSANVSVFSNAVISLKNDVISEESIMDSFLDKVNEIRGRIVEMTNNISQITLLLGEFSWKTFDNEQSKREFEEVLDVLKTSISPLKKFYVDLNNKLRPGGLCSNELKSFKDELDELQESSQDIYKLFFVYPNDQDFVELNQRLDNV